MGSGEGVNDADKNKGDISHHTQQRKDSSVIQTNFKSLQLISEF